MIRVYGSYWVPPTKQGLVDWLYIHRGWVKSKLQAMSKKQLYAIYHKERGQG